MKLRVAAVVIVLLVLCGIGVSQEQKFAELGDFKLVSGEVIKDCRIGYRTFGQMNADKSNVVLFPTWFGGTSEELGNYQIGAGKTIDPAKYFVIAVDALANGVSSSPSNSKQQPGPKFPKVTIRDMVETEYVLLTKTFGLKHVHAVMGVSMGGMQTFQWGVSHPEFMDVLIPIVGTPQQSSYDLLLWNTEVDEILTDPDYQGGNYKTKPSLKTVARIQQLNMTTPSNRARETAPPQFGKYYSEQWTKNDANDTVRQLQAMIAHDIPAQFGGSMEKAAAAVKAPMMIIVAMQDHMVNPIAAIKFANIKNAELVQLGGDCGHLAPGCEQSVTTEAVSRALSWK